jgi:hypothetical protein
MEQEQLALEERVRKLEGRKGSNWLVSKVGPKGIAALFVVVLMSGMAAGVTMVSIAGPALEGFTIGFSATDLTVASVSTDIIGASEWSFEIVIENLGLSQHRADVSVAAVDGDGTTLAFEQQLDVIMLEVPPTTTLTFSLVAPDIVAQTQSFSIFVEQTA